MNCFPRHAFAASLSSLPIMRSAVAAIVVALALGHGAIFARAADATQDPKSRQIAIPKQLRKRCEDVIRKGLHAEEFWPSIHAAEALTLAGHGDEVIDFLTPKLVTEKDDQKRCGLARELVRAGDRTKAAIMLDILAGKDPHGHVHACESLYKVGEIGDGRLFRQAIKSKGKSSLQIMAAAALGRHGSGAAMKLLRQKLAAKDPMVSRIAAWVLGRIGDESDIPRLRMAGAKASDPLTRCYFDNSLAALGDAAGLKALSKNLHDKDPALRVYAATFAGDARAVSTATRLEELLDDPVLDVRIRAAQSLCVLSQPAPLPRDEEITRDVYAATKAHPRYSEGSIIELRDGALLFATTEFISGGSDFSKAHIVARTSSDGGRTWGLARILQKNIGQKNVMSVTLRRLTRPTPGGALIGMFYLVKNDFDNLNVYLRVSHDECQSFSEPIRVSNRPGYHVMNNDRVTLLSSGRLLAPVASTEDVRKVNHFVSYCFISDDQGKTWRSGKGEVDLPKRGAMEPEVFEFHDGRVGMITRSQLGYIALSESSDGGDTWSKPVSSTVRAPEAPSTLRRIPATGDLLLVWNDTYTPGAGHGGKRTPLTAAVSSDEGRSWRHVRQLETRKDQSYAYTSLTFAGPRAVLSYYVRDEQAGRISTRFRSLPVRWFYQK